MTKLKLSNFIITLFILSTYGGLSHAEEMLLCLNATDQYVVAVDQEDGCLEEESPMKISGSNLADLRDLTPVAVFEENDSCETEGSVIKLGFDKNDNYELDDDEIISTSRNCKVVAEE